MNPTRKSDLFIITGASGVGKSTVSEILFRQEKDYIVLESDILWDNRFNKPEDNYREYRELWMTLCYHISQVGLPVVLCGCTTPDQFETCDARKYFKNIHYIAVVSDNEALVRQMRDGRKISDENWINGSKDFNTWLIKNFDRTEPNIKLIDSSGKEPERVAEEIDRYIMELLSM